VQIRHEWFSLTGISPDPNSINCWLHSYQTLRQSIASNRRIAELEKRCGDEIQARERTLEADTRYRQVKQRHDIAEKLFGETSMANNQRPPTMWGKHWTYWIALFCIGVAEWLINYDTFYLFTQVPAIAAGATIIMGFLLAFSAHGHGTVFKQWSHVFSPAKDPRERLREARHLLLSTFGLLVVLAAAGGSRYAAAIRTLTAHGGPNLLGAEAEIDVNPARDVLISLLANIAAWAVGVFVAWIAHDQDPDYMDATHERDRARKQYIRRRAKADRDIESIGARFAKKVEQLKNTVLSRLRKVERQRADLAQITAHENAIISACRHAFQASVNIYRDTLVTLALSGKMPISLVAAESERVLTPYEYKNTPLLVDDEYVRGML
jgi:hypothetical protein